MDKYIKNIAKKSAKITIGIFIFGLIFQMEEIYIGFTYGAIISILNFLLLARDTYKAFENGAGSFSSTIKSYLKRYAMIFILMIGAIKISTGVFVGAAFGLMLVKYVILSETVVNRINDKLQKLMKGGD